jgi:hypothetical protein
MGGGSLRSKGNFFLKKLGVFFFFGFVLGCVLELCRGEDFCHLGQSVEHIIVSHSGLMCR